MPVQLVKLVNFGKSRSGLATVGYRILRSDGTTATARTTSGIYELVGGSGVYGAHVVFSSSFNGSIVWDSGQSGANLLYAAEQHNHFESNPNVDETMVITQAIYSASLILTGTVISGSTVYDIPTTISASNDFYTGHFIRVTDLVSGSVVRPVEEYFSTSGTFVVSPALPFIPLSGSTVHILTDFDSEFGGIG